jgi:preprotein translocase subunit SecG
VSDLQVKDLLQAKALGCLDPEEDEIFIKCAKEDKNFPWKEYGSYQKIVSCMPVLLELEIPNQGVKDKVSKILYDLNERLISEENSVKENNSDDEIIIEELEESKDIKLQEIPNYNEVTTEKKEITDSISIKKHETSEIPLTGFENLNKETITKRTEKLKKKSPVNFNRKELKKKPVKNYSSKIPTSENFEGGNKTKLFLITAVTLLIITLFLVIFIYFKFSSNIESNKNEIENLKQQISSEVINNKLYLNNLCNA